jgi:uncharacterized protein
MQINWSDLGGALALYFVLEGIVPFINPQGLKRTMLALSQMDDKPLRIFGLVSMLAGLLLLHFVYN